MSDSLQRMTNCTADTMADMHPLSGKRLLTQNSELKPHRIWNWTLPAFYVTLSDGTRFNACPNAGACARVCYARFGTYRFRNVLSRHIANLEYALHRPDEWAAQMTKELAARKFRLTGIPRDLDHDPADEWAHEWVRSGGTAVRIHDSGDFFSRAYFDRWVSIASDHPSILFYAYTKEVTMTSGVALPPNMRLIASLGGLEDSLIDRESTRHAEVFPTRAALQAAGYYDQSGSDLLAALAPSHRIGIVANNIPVAVKRFNGRPMSEMVAR